MALARARRHRLQLGEVRGAALFAVRRVEHDGQHVGDGRARVPTLGQRAPAAQHEQPAAALVHEVRDHLELVVREERGLDAAQDQSPVLEQLLARAREAGGSPSKYRIFSVRFSTTISACCSLFCATISPGRGGMWNRKVRAPGSSALKWTRTVVASPSRGSRTSWRATMRPSSSTWSGTVSPA